MPPTMRPLGTLIRRPQTVRTPVMEVLVSGSVRLRTVVVVGGIVVVVVGEAGAELDEKESDADETPMTLGDVAGDGEEEEVSVGAAEMELTDQLDTGVPVRRSSYRSKAGCVMGRRLLVVTGAVPGCRLWLWLVHAPIGCKRSTNFKVEAVN